MANIIITQAVLSVLSLSRIQGNILILPPEQLDRDLYEDVNEVLKKAGGKWKRGHGHVFPFDPKAKIAAMLDQGVAVDEKQKFQAFYTPPELATKLVSWADVRGKVVLEPSAGLGAIVNACLTAGARSVYPIEINPECQSALIGRNRYCTIADFLTCDFDLLVDRVVMNPPFAYGQYLKHIARAMKWLKQGGRLVSVMPGNVDYTKLRTILAGTNWTVDSLPLNSFKSSGTVIDTCVLTVNF